MIGWLGLLALFVSNSAMAGAGGGNGTGVVFNLPEPTSLAVLAAGISALLVARRNRRK